MSESHFIITESGERQAFSYFYMPEELQEIWHTGHDITMSLSLPEPVPSKASVSAAFIALDDVKGSPRRMKLSRIATWNRKHERVNPEKSHRADIITQPPGSHGGQSVSYAEMTEVKYGSDYFTFDMPVEQFDELIVRAGGSMTTAKPAKC